MKVDKKLEWQQWLEPLLLWSYLQNELKDKGNNTTECSNYSDEVHLELAKKILSKSAVLLIEPTRKCYAKAGWALFKKALGYQVFDLFLCIRRCPSKKDTSINSV
mgnify:CR=1 FL=1